MALPAKKPCAARRPRTSKQQAAMEYLMTYGWAILVVAIVVVAIFSLGLFNPSNLGPKARAGSCQIYRPEGIWTAAFINLEGTCNNAVPEFVAQFNGGSYILISNPDLFDSGTFTVTAWVNINNPSTFHTLIGREMSTQGWNFLLSSSGALGLRIDTNTITNKLLYSAAGAGRRIHAVRVGLLVRCVKHELPGNIQHKARPKLWDRPVCIRRQQRRMRSFVDKRFLCEMAQDRQLHHDRSK